MKRRKVLHVTEIHTLASGDTALVLRDGSTLVVGRVTPSYSGAHRFSPGEAKLDGHALLACELPDPGKGICF